MGQGTEQPRTTKKIVPSLGRGEEGWESGKSGPRSTTTRRALCLPNDGNLCEQGFYGRIILAADMVSEVHFTSHWFGRKDKTPSS